MNPESNSGTFYFNTNRSRSFVQSATTSLSALSAFPCSEVLIVNRTEQDLFLYDNNEFSDNHRFLIADGESIVIRGITNTESVSAKTATGSGDIYYRASNFSNYNQG
jgi:hypothetical protein